jgi:hypothetical protein
MKGPARIENTRFGMLAVRGSQGWLDPAVQLTNVRAATVASLGSTVTR